MQSVDHDGSDDDDALQQYVAAFRRVEQPSPAARDATWGAIGQRTSTSSRTGLWVGAAATIVAAAAWILLSADGLRLSLLGASDDDVRGDQAGYMPVVDEELGTIEETRREPPRAVAPKDVASPIEPVVEPAPVEPVVEPAAPSKRRPEPARTAPTLADETALFAEIQAALVEKRPTRALELIARHEKEFPRGAFREERVVAKAQALCAVGRTTAARKVRAKFLASNAASHLAPRMRAVCPD